MKREARTSHRVIKAISARLWQGCGLAGNIRGVQRRLDCKGRKLWERLQRGGELWEDMVG